VTPRTGLRAGLAVLTATELLAVSHVTRLDGFPAGDALAQTVGTGLHLVLTAGLLGLTWLLAPGGGGRVAPDIAR